MEMQLNMKSEETSTETQMVIPDGYKLTELGEIPEDWQCLQLGEIGECIIGLTYSPRDVSDTGTLVLRSSNVQNNKLAYQDNVFVNMDLPERVIVRKGDILICVRNGSRQLIGKCALIDQKAEGFAFGAFMSIYRTSAHDYIFYQFQSDLIQNQINETMGATINQITNKDLSSFKIPIPICVEEQKAIANVLSDTDALITELEQLITKKQAIKTATMQQLLTGRTRLPQFAKHPDGVLKGNKPSELGLIPEDWICVKLGEIGECIIGLTYSPRDVSDTGTLVLRSSNVQNNKLAYQDNVFVNMDLPERVIVRKGDILICVRNG
ncbi:restriction endonuclease subunit S, partial [Serratia liquefaciens]|uniref:restriction endonuclease subunit S n=1 Tax=Serratia liquefaciens TaxID=614 RepID=UPI0022B9C18D